MKTCKYTYIRVVFTIKNNLLKQQLITQANDIYITIEAIQQTNNKWYLSNTNIMEHNPVICSYADKCI